jgi:signal transduction histidine kinase
MALLATAAGAVIAMAAPTAYYLVRRQEEFEEARTVAVQIARVIKDVAETRGELWRYDGLKLAEGLEGFEDEDEIALVVVLDHHGHRLPVPIRVGANRTPFDAVWSTAPVWANNKKIALVAVAMDPAELMGNAFILFIAFGIAGCGLGVLIYGRATREVERAEHEVQALVRSLETARVSLEADLVGATQRIATLSERTTRLLEEDRAEIARDLHDGVGQSLYALKLRLELLADQLPSTDLKSAAERTASLVDTAIQEVRSATKAMVPPALEKLGLAGAVRAACDLVASAGDVDVALDLGTLPDDLPPDVASACYRVIQEGLTNAAKHGGAKRIEVALGADDGILRIAVRDDGRGFDPARVRRGVGLDGMQARIAALGGAVILQSKEGHGTSLEARVPMTT